MTGQPPHEVTGLLQAWRSGDKAALDALGVRPRNTILLDQ